MSPMIMYMTSSLGSLWNSLRNSRPRATNAMLSGACHSTVLGRPEPRIVFITSPRLTAFMSSMAALSPQFLHHEDPTGARRLTRDRPERSSPSDRATEQPAEDGIGVGIRHDHGQRTAVGVACLLGVVPAESALDRVLRLL